MRVCAKPLCFYDDFFRQLPQRGPEAKRQLSRIQHRIQRWGGRLHHQTLPNRQRVFPPWENVLSGKHFWFCCRFDDECRPSRFGRVKISLFFQYGYQAPFQAKGTSALVTRVPACLPDSLSYSFSTQQIYRQLRAIWSSLMSNRSRFMIFQRKTSISSQLPPSHNILTLEARERENNVFIYVSYHTFLNHVRLNAL